MTDAPAPLADDALAAIRERRRLASNSADWPTAMGNFGYTVRTANGAETVWKVQLGQCDLEFCRGAAADVDALLTEVGRLRAENELLRRDVRAAFRFNPDRVHAAIEQVRRGEVRTLDEIEGESGDTTPSTPPRKISS